MFQKINVKFKSTLLRIVDDEYFVIESENQIFINKVSNLKQELIIRSKLPLSDIFIANSKWYAIDSIEGNLLKTNNDNTFNICNKETKYSPFTFTNNKVRYRNFEKKSVGVYDLLKKKSIFEVQNLKSRYCFIKNDFLITDNTNSNQNDWTVIEKYNFSSNNFEWSFDLNTLYQNISVEKFITLYKNILVIAGGYDKLIALNIQTGKLLWQIDKCNNTNYALDKSDGKLKGITNIGYFEVDIQKGAYKRTLFMDIEKMDDPTIFDSQRDNFVLVGNHIITTDWRKGLIGAFNTKTLQFDWIHEEKGVSFPGGNPIKYVEPYLFVIDNKNTLHIFKNDKKILT